jgi:hypothetical protein
MALTPVISLSLNNKCDKVTMTESTGLYVTPSNEGGWGTPNIDTTNITLSELKIYDYLGTTLKDTYDLTGLYPSATPSEFTILLEAGWELPDGIYQIKYEITDDSLTPVIYRNETTHELFICNLCNCKNSLVQKLVKACDTLTIEKLKTQVDQMEIFIYGIQSAFACGDFATANSILASASTYCTTVSNCGCGC